ncbi:MAG: cytochrome c, partial [Fuerstiella sp.]
NCADCHGISAKGNGPQTTIYEENPVTKQLYTEPGLHDVWDNVNQPRNLTQGIYRGGRRPIDLFRRIHAGIKGSRMPSFKNLKHEDIWHIVNYVLSVPFNAEPGHAPVATSEDPATAASL